MKAEELRLGNYLKGTITGAVFQVEKIEPRMLDEMLCTIPPRPIVEAIPLTEEWLDKLGFRIHSDYDYRNFFLPKNNFMISMWPGEGQPGGFEEHGVCYWGDGYLTIRYVHQLQNLYFVMTGQELTIKP